MKLGNLGQRERVLLAALALLVPIFAWQYLKPWLLDLGGGGAGGLGRSSSVARRMTARKELLELRLSMLRVESGEYEPGRNLFDYGKAPQPTPPPRPPPPPRPKTVEVAAPPPAEPATPRPPKIDVQLIGIFGPERRRIAVLTDGEGSLLNVLEQDTIHEKFIVHEIGYESIDLKFVGFPDVAPERVKIGG